MRFTISKCRSIYTCVNTVPRRLVTRRCLLLFFRCLLLAALLPVIVMLIPPIRNVVLYPWWPRVWRQVDTIGILQMSQREYPKNVTKLLCTKRTKPLYRNETLFSGMHFLTKPAFPVTDLNSAKTLPVRHPAHRLFMPAMSKNEAKDLLYIYLVMAEALKKVNVEYFLEGGSMLGSMRHQGFIPWDDDLDIAINVKDWQKVRTALSCIEGFHLHIQPNMHWAFRSSDSTFPYIDIFLYVENERYIWSQALYLMRATLVLRKKDVFPLTTGYFEGHIVPLPGDYNAVARTVFGTDYCLSPESHHRDHIDLPNRQNVLCSELSYLYPSLRQKN